MGYSNGFQSRNQQQRRGLGFRPLEVTVENNDVERALRVLKREVGKEGVLKTLKLKRYFEKPSEAKKRKAREALRRVRRTIRRKRT